MEEVENWQCCGGVYTAATDEIATKLSSVRALAQAQDKGQDLLTLCSACHNVIKRTNYDIQTDEVFASRVNNYMASDGMEYHGATKVVHYLEMLRDVVGFDVLKSKVVNPLRLWLLMIRKIRRLWKILSAQSVQNRLSIRREMNAAADIRH